MRLGGLLKTESVNRLGRLHKDLWKHCYLTIRPIAPKGYESIAHEEKPYVLLTRGPHKMRCFNQLLENDQRHSNLFDLQLNFTMRFIRELPSCLTFCPVKARVPSQNPSSRRHPRSEHTPPHDVSLWRGFPLLTSVHWGFPSRRQPIDVTKNPLMLSARTPPHSLHSHSFLAPSLALTTCTSLTSLP